MNVLPWVACLCAVAIGGCIDGPEPPEAAVAEIAPLPPAQVAINVTGDSSVVASGPAGTGVAFALLLDHTSGGMDVRDELLLSTSGPGLGFALDQHPVRGVADPSTALRSLDFLELDRGRPYERLTGMVYGTFGGGEAPYDGIAYAFGATAAWTLNWTSHDMFPTASLVVAPLSRVTIDRSTANEFTLEVPVGSWTHIELDRTKTTGILEVAIDIPGIDPWDETRTEATYGGMSYTPRLDRFGGSPTDAGMMVARFDSTPASEEWLWWGLSAQPETTLPFPMRDRYARA